MNLFGRLKRRERVEVITLQLGSSSLARLAELRRLFQVKTNLQVIRLALQITSKLVDEQNKGSRVVVETITKDGITFEHIDLG